MIDIIKQIARNLIDGKSRKIDIAAVFVWLHYSKYGESADIKTINSYFSLCNLPEFHVTQLREGLKKSKNVTRGTVQNTYKPTLKYDDALKAQFPFAVVQSEEIVTDDCILPDALVNNTRGYIISLSQQINASYNNNIFDGCAILMRRLLEILLIHSYEAIGKLDDIKTDSGFNNLSYIINSTLSNKPFNLHKDSEEIIDTFRVLGNFAAHKIQYTTKRKDIDNVKLRYRLLVQELLYISEILK